MKALDPRIATVLGGGYVNTELRALSDPRLFDDFDYVTYDDGEVPLLRIVERQAAGAHAGAAARPRGLAGRLDGAGAAPPRSACA